MAGKLLDSPRARRKGTDQALVGLESNNRLPSPPLAHQLVMR
jgi:hypothetical protein